MDAGPSRTPTHDDNDPFGEPPSGWLHPLESDHSYNEGEEFEVSEAPMEEDSELSIPEALCALAATEQEVQQSVVPLVYEAPGTFKDVKKKSYSLAVLSAEMRNLTVSNSHANVNANSTCTIAAHEAEKVAKDVKIRAEIMEQDKKIQEVCIQRNMEWVYHSKDILPWANEFPFIKALVTSSDILLQPKVFRTSQQYTDAMDGMALDILKAKRLLLSQEMDVMQQEVHHFKAMGLKRAEMASNHSLIQFVQALLDESPILLSDMTSETALKTTVREIYSTRCLGHVPLYAGMYSYPLPDRMLDNKSKSIALRRKNPWMHVISHKNGRTIVHKISLPETGIEVPKCAHQTAQQHTEPVMCFAAVEESSDDEDLPEGVVRDDPMQDVVEEPFGSIADRQAAIIAEEIRTDMAQRQQQIAADAKRLKADKAAATKQAKKDRAEAQRAKKATRSARVTRGSTRPIETVTPATTPGPTYTQEALDALFNANESPVGTVFPTATSVPGLADGYVGTTGATGSRTVMGPPLSRVTRETLPLGRTLLSSAPAVFSPVTATTTAAAAPVAASSSVPPAITSDNVHTVGALIRERFEAQYPGSTFSAERILQSMLPEGYRIVNSNPTLPPVPTGCDGADDPPDRPENFPPREDGESDAAFNKRVDDWSRVHSIYLQQLTAHNMRMKTREMVRARTSSSDKNIRKISDCTKDTPISDWLRQTRLNLIARNVHNEFRQVEQASSYLYSVLQRRWIIAKDKALLDNKPITWRLFANHLLTGVDGVKPAEAALHALQNFSVQPGKSAASNLHSFQKTLDHCVDCLPGTRYQMPSGYELCTLFIDRVVKNLPKDISNSLIDTFVSKVTAQEETEFFLGSRTVIDEWYREQTELLLLQGIAKANALPKVGAIPPQLPDRNQPQRNGQTPSKPSLFGTKGGIQKKLGKRPSANGGGGAPNKIQKSLKYSDFMESLRVNPNVDIGKLFNEKGRCTFCGMNNHMGKDCTANLAKKFPDDPAKAKNNHLARELASKFFPNSKK